MVKRDPIAIPRSQVLPLGLLVFLTTFTSVQFSLWVNAQVEFFPGQAHFLLGFLTPLLVATVLVAGFALQASRLALRERQQVGAVLSRIHQSPDRVRFLADLREGYFCLDANWCVLYVNPAAYALLEVPLGSLEGHKIWELLPEFCDTEFYQHYRQLYAAGGKQEFEAYDPHFHAWFRVYAVCRDGVLEVYFTNIDAEQKVRRQLSESALREQLMFERATLGLAEIGPTGQWLKVNPALCEFLGVNEADLLGHRERDLSPGEQDAQEQALIDQINRGERDDYALTKQYRRPDGSTRWAEIQRVAIRDPLSGQVQYFIAMIKDVDEQHRGQQVLKNAERHFRQVADSAPMMVWQVNAGGEPLYFNRAWREFLYLDGELPSNARWTDPLHPEERLLCEQVFHAALQRREEFQLDFRIRRHDGRYRWLTQVARPLLEGATFNGFIATATDITDRKLQEQQVKASESRLRGITSGLPGTVFELTHHRQSGEWRFQYLSDGSQTLLQRPVAELLRDFSLFLGCFAPREIDKVLEELTQAAAQGRPSSRHELRLTTPTQPWIELRVAVSQDRRLDIFHGIMLDVTEKKQIERERARTAARIQELSLHNIQLKEAERKSIAREIHDEFGQLLTVMKMDVRMLAMKLPPEFSQAQDDLKQIERLIGDTVAASRRVIAHLRPPAVDLGLDAGVEWLLEDFRQRTDIECSLRLPETPPEVPEAVAVHVFRILQESLNNVMKHANATRVAVSLQLAGDRLELEVSDNGRGFDPSRSSRQFGLLGIRERLNLLDGQLRLKSQPGTGVQLVVTVPLQNFSHPHIPI